MVELCRVALMLFLAKWCSAPELRGGRRRTEEEGGEGEGVR